MALEGAAGDAYLVVVEALDASQLGRKNERVDERGGRTSPWLCLGCLLSNFRLRAQVDDGLEAQVIP